MFAIAAISSRQTIVNKYLQNNKGVNWNGLTVDDFVVVVFVVGFAVVVCVAGFVVEAQRTLRNTGLSTSRGVFQRYVSSIFRDLTRKGIVISYLDDLVIPAKNEQEGLEKLKIIFEVAKKYRLEIKFKKCQFLKKKIEFLGHIVESGTIKSSPTKTLAVRKFPEPTTIKQVQSFLGLTGYFRKYIKDYSKIAKPLRDLTRKGNLFVFGIQQKKKKKHLKN
ncbi:retrovirus-related Pol polyprotein from transposon 17.6 [Trichonephila clavipes]|nr:retrovirus-related Pol polyprotein from transposon 17.6 [Trichonephila clavipes]